ncbi:hypothetical protein BCR32DRAFT_325975, partial [Anaeromyces robustus]
MARFKEQLNNAYKDTRTDNSTLTDLSKKLHKTQRDFYILIFTLFCAIITYLLHLLVLKMENYRMKYISLKEMYTNLEKKCLELSDKVNVLETNGNKINQPTEDVLPEYSVEDKNNLTKRNNTTKKD